MSIPCEIWVMRHGERLDHVDRSWPSTANVPFNPPLTQVGLEQAKKAAQYFKARGLSWHRIYSSPLTRTLQTAHKIADEFDALVHPDLALMEWCDGTLPGLVRPIEEMIDWHGIHQEFPRVRRDYFAQQALLSRVPRVESRSEVNSRVTSALNLLAERHASDRVLVVTHGQILSDALTLVGKTIPGTDFPYTAIVRLTRQGGQWSLLEPVHADHIGTVLSGRL